MVVFCIDTSSLVEAAARRYPRAMFPAVWDLIEREVAAGRLISSEMVRDELERRDDELHAWARGQTHLFQLIDEPVQTHLRTIVRAYPRMVASGKRNMADPWVVALAQERGATVITEEQGGALPRNPKIPLVCRELGIPCINFLAWLQHHGITFTASQASPVQ